MRYLNSLGERGQRVFIVEYTPYAGTDLIATVRSGLGRRVVGSWATTGQDFSEAASQIAASQATAVYFEGGPFEGGVLAGQIQQAGLAVPIVAGSKLLDPIFLTEAGTVAEGTIVVCNACPELSEPEVLLPGYADRYGTEPTFWAQLSYDATRIFLQGLEAGADTREEMLAWVDQYDRETALGRIRFTSSGDIDASLLRYWVFTVVRGEFVRGDTPI